MRHAPEEKHHACHRDRLPAIALVLAATLVALLVAAPGSADAMSRGQADRLAKRILKPQKLDGNVALFGLPKPLGPSKTVVEAGPAKVTRKLWKRSPGTVRVIHKAPKLERRTWIYWLDEQHGAGFQHRSRLLLLDDRTGVVRMNRRLRMYPLVDGRKPTFLRSAKSYFGSKYKVFSNVPEAGSSSRERGGGSEGTTGQGDSKREPAAEAADNEALPQNAFADDCLITANAVGEEWPEQSAKAMRDWAASVGMRAFAARGSRPSNKPDWERIPNGETLMGDVRRAVRNEKCKDVMLYLTGHGWTGGLPGVYFGSHVKTEGFGPWKKVTEYAQYATQEDLEAIARAFPDTTFKFKIDACFSGRFITEANYPGNVLITETASKEYQVSYIRLESILMNGKLQRNPNPAPKVTQFAYNDLEGLKTFGSSIGEVAHALDEINRLNSPATARWKVSLLAWALARSVDLGKGVNFASSLGQSKPQISSIFDVTDPSGAPQQVGYTK